MVEHPVFDVTFGLIFVHVILSLVCSAAQELVASLAGLRSRNLEAGIRNLVGDDLAQAVYGHRLVKGLSKKNRLPSYLSAKTFSTVLLEVVARLRASGGRPRTQTQPTSRSWGVRGFRGMRGDPRCEEESSAPPSPSHGSAAGLNRSGFAGGSNS